jgi:antitoxin component YwqK of YwqJK toxin-antitoxin module
MLINIIFECRQINFKSLRVMKKSILLLALLFVVASTYSQADTNVKTEKKGDLTEATYFYADGKIQQQGTFNADGKLHGTWTSYDTNGNKLAVGNYENNKKVGKWFFWTNEVLKEVDYIDSKIVSVNEWADKTEVAIRN